MKEFGAIAMLITIVVTTTIGVRLLLVARRNGEPAEAFFGLAFVCGGLGQGLGQLGRRALWPEPSVFATTMNTLLFGLVVVGLASLFYVVWRVFRPDDRRGVVTFGLGIAVLLIGYGIRIGNGDFAANGEFGHGMRLYLFARISCFCWITMEAFYYSAQLFKRARLGLADVMPAHQIRMWGVTGIANMALSVLVGWYTLELGRSPLDDFWAVCAILVIVAVTVTSMWIAFFPPAALARWLRGRVEQEPATA